jgi:tol-pal system protein YbgF
MREAAKRSIGRLAGVAALVLFAGASFASAPPSTPVGVPNYVGPSQQPATLRLAALFGESDEEKAARQQHEDNQDQAIQGLNQKIRDLEETLRQQTGQSEVLSHRIQELNDKLDRQQKDFEYRLCAMAAQQLGSTPGQPGGTDALPCNVTGAPTASAGAPPQAMLQAPPPSPGTGGPMQLGKPPGTLGTLTGNDAVPLPPPQAQPVNTQPQFDAALNLLAKAQYDEARAAFRGFADTYPKDPLAAQAVYWVGDIAYVQKDYPNAARAFAEEIKKYPTSTRGPDSMLKLGQSLLAMGQKKEGCTSLAALPVKYPQASKTIASQAVAARKAASCRR